MSGASPPERSSRCGCSSLVAGLGVPTLAVLAYLRAGEPLISDLPGRAGRGRCGLRLAVRAAPAADRRPGGRRGDQPGTAYRDRVGRPDGDRPGRERAGARHRGGRGPRPGASRSPGRRRGRDAAPGRTGSWPSSRTCRTSSTRRWRTSRPGSASAGPGSPTSTCSPAGAGGERGEPEARLRPDAVPVPDRATSAAGGVGCCGTGGCSSGCWRSTTSRSAWSPGTTAVSCATWPSRRATPTRATARCCCSSPPRS